MGKAGMRFRGSRSVTSPSRSSGLSAAARHEEALSIGRLSEPSVLYDNVSIGQTVTQMPQPMHDEVALSLELDAPADAEHVRDVVIGIERGGNIRLPAD